MYFTRCFPLLLLLLAPGTHDDAAAALERCPKLGPRCDLRIERFVIESRATDEQGRVHATIEGFVEWRRRDDEGGPQLELDVRFLHGPEHARDVERVIEVECLTDRGPRCQWREVGPGSGRSVQAEWTSDGSALDIVEWSAAGKQRGTLVASGGVSMPLYLAELLRQGRITAGAVIEFDPLARTLEPLTVRTVWLVGADPIVADAASAGGVSIVEKRATDAPVVVDAPREARTVELLRADGTLAARYRYEGLTLVGFQWQEGRMSARAVDETEFERLLAREIPSEPPGSRSRH
jgi:hypothetical protein